MTRNEELESQVDNLKLELVNAKTCDSCVNSKNETAYLKDTLENFSKGKKQLNMILDKSKTPYKKHLLTEQMVGQNLQI